jgi:Icc protein
MDENYPLQNMDVVQGILFNHLRPLPIFCGHYHVEKTLCARNLTIHLTPSTFFQIDWSSRNFKIDHFRTALREIILRPDGIVESTVIYYEGNKL